MEGWDIVLIIVQIATLLLGIMLPVIKLNGTITELSTTLKHALGRMEQLEGVDREIKEHSSEVHRRIHARIDDDEKRLQNHEIRINNLEKEHAQ